MHFLTEPPLRQDTKARVDQQQPDQQVLVNRWPTGLALEIGRMGAGATQID